MPNPAVKHYELSYTDLSLLCYYSDITVFYVIKYFFLLSFFASGVGFPLYPEIFYTIHNETTVQCLRIIVGDAGFEPAGPLPQKSSALAMIHHISLYIINSVV